MVKKSVVSLMLLVLSLFLVGCLDYKAYDVNKETSDAELVDEIAAIEKQLMAEETTTEVEEEVVLPELGEAPQEISEEDLSIISVKENDLVKLKVKATDPNGDLIQYTFSPPLNNLGSWKTNYGDAGEYIVTITASDGQLTTEKRLKLVVERVNMPPVIGTLRDLTYKEGDVVNFQAQVTDPNNDAVSVTVSEPLARESWATDSKSSGDYLIKVEASDGELTSEKTFQLTILDVNLAPQISGLENIYNIKEGETLTLEPIITDEDEDEGKPVVVTISEPVGNNGEWTPNYTQRGTYYVTVTADDGRGAVVTKKITINVEPVNMPPEITDVSLDIN